MDNGIKAMRTNAKSDMNPIAHIPKNQSAEAMISALKNKRKNTANMKLQMKTTSQSPLNLGPGSKEDPTGMENF